MKFVEMWRCRLQETSACLLTAYYFFAVLFVTVTIDGFLHDDISFAKKQVIVPWDEQKWDPKIDEDDKQKK